MSQTNENKSRRDLLFLGAGGATAVVAGTKAVWPSINQMNASADVRALSKVQFDLSQVPEGTQSVIEWQLKPVFIRHRTAEEIETARQTALDDLKDTSAENENAPDADASDENRALGEDGKYLVAVGLCTHLGCVPTLNEGDYDGWFCPCHGSHYDTSGRIRKGPAPKNLPIPPIRFVSDTVIEIGV